MTIDSTDTLGLTGIQADPVTTLCGAPAAIAAIGRVMPRGVGPLRSLTRRGRVRAAFGTPLVAAAGDRRARTEQLRAATRTAIDDLTAPLADDGFAAAAATTTAAAVDRTVTDALDDAGRLASDRARRQARVLRVAHDGGSRGVDLAVQRIRLAGLEAVGRRGPARVASVLPLGPRLRRVLRAHPDHGPARYLLGRWQLMVPRAVGGGPVRARGTFALAARHTAPGDTRALGGLAEACAALDDVAGQRHALRQIVTTTPPQGRGAARVERARTTLSRLEETPAHPGPGVRVAEGAAS